MEKDTSSERFNTNYFCGVIEGGGLNRKLRLQVETCVFEWSALKEESQAMQNLGQAICLPVPPPRVTAADGPIANARLAGLPCHWSTNCISESLC